MTYEPPPNLGALGLLGGLPVRVSRRLYGPYAVVVAGMLILPGTRPSIRYPLYEEAARLAGIVPWYFDPAKWPDRVRIDYSAIGL